MRFQDAYISLHYAYLTTWGKVQLGAELDYRIHGGKRYYALEPGTEYGIRVNMPGNWSNVEIVVALDGRDVLKNEPANFETHRGYLTRESKCDVDGWRTSDTNVKLFVAESLGQGKTTSEKSGGAASARGTIGAAIFSEKRQSPVYRSRGVVLESTRGGFESMSFGASRGGGDEGLESFVSHGPSGLLGGSPTRGVTRSGGARGASAGGGQQTNSVSRGGGYMKSAAAVPAPSVGTAAGASAVSAVTKSQFIRDGAPTLIEIEYDSRANLIARGIFEAQGSKAWPGMPVKSEFCDPNKL